VVRVAHEDWIASLVPFRVSHKDAPGEETKRPTQLVPRWSSAYRKDEKHTIDCELILEPHSHTLPRYALNDGAATKMAISPLNKGYV